MLTSASRIPLPMVAGFRICGASLRLRAAWWRSLAEIDRFRYWMTEGRETPTEAETGRLEAACLHD
jgi:hypothetical protein